MMVEKNSINDNFAKQTSLRMVKIAKRLG